MKVLPLFPLSVVLFPGARMPLHIFEPRYREMVAWCLENGGRFGLMHHNPDEQGPFLLEEARVGTVAEIEEHQPIPDGRSLIMVRGVERFQIVEGLEQRRLFYEADVRPYLDVTRPQEDAILTARQRTLELFHTVLESLDEPPEDLPLFDLRHDLSFQLSPLIQIDARWQQSFLELREEVHRLERLDAVFQAAVDRA
jgi:Lon protease-like protein